MTPGPPADGPGEHRLSADWLSQGAAAKVLAILNGDGEEARAVGGAVRNALLGEPVGEIDVATTARPEEVVRRAEAAGFKPVPTGIEHGTVTIVVQGQPVEVTTLREDVETFGRHARVAFGRDWQRDAERRDFTINAFSASPDGIVHDYVGGFDDLAKRRIRFIGDPAQRIAEDYLRILRFFRFHAAYGEGPPDADGLHATIVAREGVRTLSRERIRNELMKTLVARHAIPVLAVMSETGLLVTLVGVPQLASLSNMAKLELALGLAPDPVRRLGALAVRVEEDALRLTEALRLANHERDRLQSMAQGWWRVSPEGLEQGGRVLLYRLGSQSFVDRVLLAWTRSEAAAHDEAWRGLVEVGEQAAPVFPLKAADLMARGVLSGPPLGKALRAAESAWIAAGFPASGDTLTRIADEAARQ